MIGFAVGVWEVVAVVWVALSAGAAVGWALHSSLQRGRGGMLDLSPAAARGELDLDWRDPRDEAARRWSETTRAEQDAWVKDGTIAPWRLEGMSGERFILDGVRPASTFIAEHRD